MATASLSSAQLVMIGVQLSSNGQSLTTDSSAAAGLNFFFGRCQLVKKLLSDVRQVLGKRFDLRRAAPAPPVTSCRSAIRNHFRSEPMAHLNFICPASRRRSQVKSHQS